MSNERHENDATPRSSLATFHHGATSGSGKSPRLGYARGQRDRQRLARRPLRLGGDGRRGGRRHSDRVRALLDRAHARRHPRGRGDQAGRLSQRGRYPAAAAPSRRRAQGPVQSPRMPRAAMCRRPRCSGRSASWCSIRRRPRRKPGISRPRRSRAARLRQVGRVRRWSSVGATVSVGAASDLGVAGDLGALFRRADAALYVAKRAGRNRVEMLGADYASLLTDVEAAVRTGIRRPFVDLVDPLATKMRARRSRAVGAVRDDCSPRERT